VTCPRLSTAISAKPQARGHPALSKRDAPAGFEPALPPPESPDHCTLDQEKRATTYWRGVPVGCESITDHPGSVESLSTSMRTEHTVAQEPYCLAFGQVVHLATAMATASQRTCAGSAAPISLPKSDMGGRRTSPSNLCTPFAWTRALVSPMAEIIPCVFPWFLTGVSVVAPGSSVTSRVRWPVLSTCAGRPRGQLALEA
jgi:hypothetical protein